MRALPLRVVFRVAAGPRRGFGHLLRARSLARALGVPVTVSIRGTAATRARAKSLGCRVTASTIARALRRRPDVLVVDDPSRLARRWLRSARRRRITTVSIHDLGLGCAASDLAIDGSVARVRRGPHVLSGPRFAIIEPALIRARRSRLARTPGRVFISLGGGPRRALAIRLARALRRVPGVGIRVAPGFGVRWTGDLEGMRVDGRAGLSHELAACSVAVLAGGVTLYEACALGVPAVAIAVTGAQRPTIRGCARRGAAIDAGFAGDPDAVDRIVAHVRRLLGDAGRRRRLAAAGRALIDGRGAWRAARAIHHAARPR